MIAVSLFLFAAWFSCVQSYCGFVPAGYIRVDYRGRCISDKGAHLADTVAVKITDKPAGSTIVACNGDIPEGWVKTESLTSTCTYRGYSYSLNYQRYKILKYEGLPDGVEIDQCGEVMNPIIDDGFVTIQRFTGGCGDSVKRRLKKIHCFPAGHEISTCGDQDNPPGYASTAIYDCGTTKGKRLKKVHGLPVGTTLTFCDSSVPPGWIQLQRHQECGVIGNQRFYHITGRKVSDIQLPWNCPTPTPSRSPTRVPSRLPSKAPTFHPSNKPTYLPTYSPTEDPTEMPSHIPSRSPTPKPTNLRTTIPPTILPTYNISSSVECLPGFRLYNDVCYGLLLDEESWWLQQTQCQELYGGNLATIKDEETNIFITEEVVAGQCVNVWIGYGFAFGRWTCASFSTDNCMYSNWNANWRGHCGALTISGEWEAQQCTDNLMAVCAYPISTSTDSPSHSPTFTAVPSPVPTTAVPSTPQPTTVQPTEPLPTPPPTLAPNYGMDCSTGLDIFMDPRYFDTHEAMNLVSALTYFPKRMVQEFIHHPDSIHENFFQGVSAIIFPEAEHGSFYEDLSEDDKENIRNFVKKGGVSIMIGSNRDFKGHDVQLMNGIFGYNLSHYGNGISCERSFFSKAYRMDGNYSINDWDTAPDYLEWRNTIYCIDSASLPEGANILYESDDGKTVWVAQIPYGQGYNYYFAFDFFDYRRDITDWVSVLKLLLLSSPYGCGISNQPTSAPSENPSSTPTTVPTNQPSSEPTIQPQSEPTEQPSGQPNAYPTAVPSNVPTMQPNAMPSGIPSTTPTSQPSCQPTRIPSVSPGVSPSAQPASVPSSAPTGRPTTQPSVQPSQQPSSIPSTEPSAQPQAQPTSFPISQPTQQPNSCPTSFPSLQPSVQPTSNPTIQPTSNPTICPSIQPTTQPSQQPSSIPSLQPTEQPSVVPTDIPTSQPTQEPTQQSTGIPTATPSKEPSSEPSEQPTARPSLQQTFAPSNQPSAYPSEQPSSQPSCQPSTFPTIQPTNSPTSSPSGCPTIQPLCHPTGQPSSSPTIRPTSRPTPYIDEENLTNQQVSLFISNISSHRIQNDIVAKSAITETVETVFDVPYSRVVINKIHPYDPSQATQGRRLQSGEMSFDEENLTPDSGTRVDLNVSFVPETIDSYWLTEVIDNKEKLLADANSAKDNLRHAVSDGKFIKLLKEVGHKANATLLEYVGNVTVFIPSEKQDEKESTDDNKNDYTSKASKAWLTNDLWLMICTFTVACIITYIQ